MKRNVRFFQPPLLNPYSSSNLLELFSLVIIIIIIFILSLVPGSLFWLLVFDVNILKLFFFFFLCSSIFLPVFHNYQVQLFVAILTLRFLEKNVDVLVYFILFHSIRYQAIIIINNICKTYMICVDCFNNFLNPIGNPCSVWGRCGSIVDICVRCNKMFSG